MTPGSPSSSGSTTPGSPPPGLKSRHTVPTTASAAGLGVTACTAPAGTARGGIAVRPIRAVPPVFTGCFRPMPPSRRTTNTSGCDGRPCASTPVGSKVSCTTVIAALRAPLSGSCSYTSRQITPAANSEIAIGMKTTVLNATDQRMRSVSTAKMRPIAVIRAGTTAIHSALFSSAVRIVSDVNIVR